MWLSICSYLPLFLYEFSFFFDRENCLSSEQKYLWAVGGNSHYWPFGALIFGVKSRFASNFICSFECESEIWEWKEKYRNEASFLLHQPMIYRAYIGRLSWFLCSRDTQKVWFWTFPGPNEKRYNQHNKLKKYPITFCLLKNLFQ